MSATFTRRVDITDPDDRLAWRDLDGALRNLTGWALTMEIINPTTNVIEYVKTSGVVGNDGTGLSNVVVAWQTSEMEPLSGPVRWEGRILAVLDTETAEFVLDEQGTLPVWVFQPVPITGP
jgi:hypothetical protein